MSVMDEVEIAVRTQRRLIVDWDAVWQDRWPAFKPVEHRLYLGGQKACYDECHHTQICDLSLAPYSELSLIGPYLRIIQRDNPERSHIAHPGLLAKRAPIWFDRPTWSENLVYVDLERAYWSIYTRTTLDVFYDGETTPQQGLVKFCDAQAFGAYKLARNGMLGVLRRVSRRGLDHGVNFSEIVPPHRRRPDLWGLVMDCLELIAWSARNHGAVYYHTDGAIFTSDESAVQWQAYCREHFAIITTIRARGPGSVTGLSRFAIGNHKAGREGNGAPIDSMIPQTEMLTDHLTDWLCTTSMLVSESPN